MATATTDEVPTARGGAGTATGDVRRGGSGRWRQWPV